MNEAHVSIFQRGRLLHANRDHTFRFVGFGLMSGSINGVACFESVVIRDNAGRVRTVTESSYGGPVSICIRRGKGDRQWHGIAGRQTVANANLPTRS